MSRRFCAQNVATPVCESRKRVKKEKGNDYKDLGEEKIGRMLEAIAIELKAGSLSTSLIKVKGELVKKGIDVADLTREFRKYISVHAEANYFWETDGHFNSKGYAVFALAVEAELRKRGIIFHKE